MIRPDELIVDNFAGGGGASEGIERALGRPVDIAINHDPEAIAMHAANHPHTRHLCENVWAVDIPGVTKGRPVGLAWFSPDCKHFSKAKGGKPVSKKIRGLAWVVIRWAEIKRPRVIVVENVEEFQDWGPLLENNRPDPARRGLTFKRWVGWLRNLGYRVYLGELRGCDYGAPTIRKRLVVVARCDGEDPADYWPEPTHGPGLLPYRTAAECIDWTIPCPSIFLSREEGRRIGVNRPLAEATMRRIARGVRRYVIGAAEPFIVNITHQDGSSGRVEPIREPLRTITGARRGEKALVVPFFAGVGGRLGQSPERSANAPYHTVTAKADTALVVPFLGTYYGANREGGDRIGSIQEPLRTQSTENRHALVAAFLSRQFGRSVGTPVSSPAPTVTAGGGGKTALVASHIMKLRGTNIGSSAADPLQTISAGGNHHAEVRAFLMKYYGADQDPHLDEPMHTIPTRDRFALVMVQGEPYVITDIGMRMLTPRELFRAQGFADDYVIDMNGLTKTAQVRMCGNSVCPPLAEAVVRGQFTERVCEAVA